MTASLPFTPLASASDRRAPERADPRPTRPRRAVARAAATGRAASTPRRPWRAPQLGAVGVLALVAALAAASPAAAQRNGRHRDDAAQSGGGTATGAGQVQAVDQLDQAARLLFESAREAFNRGDYETALTRFRNAYDASPRPGLLYNIATTLDRLRQDEAALEAFERFLQADPNVANRSEIEARVRVLRDAVNARRAQQAAEQEQLEAARRQAEEDARRRDEEARRREQDARAGGGGAGGRGGTGAGAGAGAGRGDAVDSGGGISPVVFFVGAGLTTVAAGLLVWSGLDTLGRNDDYEAYATSPGATFDRARALYDDAAAAQTRTNVFIGVTAGLAIGTGVLLLLTDWGGPASGDASATRARVARASRPRLVPSLALAPAGGLAVLDGRF